LIRTEQEIREKIKNSMDALEDFSKKTEVSPEDFFIVARQATYMTALYWTLGEEIPDKVKKLAVPIVQRMSAAQAMAAQMPKEAPKKK